MTTPITAAKETRRNMADAGDVFDVCVIGAGVEGSSTARYLASIGKNTLLLEQVHVIVVVHSTTVHNVVA